jgi:hypothetical protein
VQAYLTDIVGKKVSYREKNGEPNLLKGNPNFIERKIDCQEYWWDDDAPNDDLFTKLINRLVGA